MPLLNVLCVNQDLFRPGSRQKHMLQVLKDSTHKVHEGRIVLDSLHLQVAQDCPKDSFLPLFSLPNSATTLKNLESTRKKRRQGVPATSLSSMVASVTVELRAQVRFDLNLGTLWFSGNVPCVAKCTVPYKSMVQRFISRTDVTPGRNQLCLICTSAEQTC